MDVFDGHGHARSMLSNAGHAADEVSKDIPGTYLHRVCCEVELHLADVSSNFVQRLCLVAYFCHDVPGGKTVIWDFGTAVD